MSNLAKKNLSQSIDIIIVGGGLAGLSMAAALSSLPVNITIVESAQSTFDSAEKTETRPEEKEYSPSFDDRALALSLASIKILHNIGVLAIEDVASLTPIEHIHVSDKGHIGMLRMTAAEVGETDLGKVIPAPLLGEKLEQFIVKANFPAQINVFDEASVQAVHHHADRVDVHVQKGDKEQLLSAKTIILADGGRSSIADQIGLPASTTDYEQIAVLANVAVDKAHQNTAYERFTDTGPIALLPLRQNEFKLVWTTLPQDQEMRLDCSDDEFLSALQQRFGFRAGSFTKVGRRVAYPMRSTKRAQIVSGRVALIGNAAHSLHPIAGQGFNLGLRDVACLAEILAEQLIQQADLGDVTALMRYQSWREQDIQRTAGFTDKLVKIFSTSAKPMAILRSAGLLALDRQPQFKREFMRKLMGVSGQRFKLLAGVPLMPIESIQSAELVNASINVSIKK